MSLNQFKRQLRWVAINDILIGEDTFECPRLIERKVLCPIHANRVLPLFLGRRGERTEARPIQHQPETRSAESPRGSTSHYRISSRALTFRRDPRNVIRRRDSSAAGGRNRRKKSCRAGDRSPRLPARMRPGCVAQDTGADRLAAATLTSPGLGPGGVPGPRRAAPAASQSAAARSSCAAASSRPAASRSRSAVVALRSTATR